MAPQSSNSVPPSLPPSVEEAYRRKCIQLKSRTNEVEEANDAARLRLARIKRQVEKLRIERSFLLEQLAKRTSANVEDSDGSPSPPPTEPMRSGIASEVDANLSKPKEKPLRIKRGHRKVDPDSKEDASASFGKDPGSPGGSDADAAQEAAAEVEDDAEGANGVSKPSKSATDAFEIYCDKIRPKLEEKHKDSDVDIEKELEKGWKELSDADKEEYQTQLEDAKAEAKLAKGKESVSEERGSPASSKKEGDKPEAESRREATDEDVEMADTEEPPTQPEKDKEADKEVDKEADKDDDKESPKKDVKDEAKDNDD